MKITLKDILVGVWLLVLLTGTAFTQSKLKSTPQIIMLVLGGLTLMTFMLKQEKIGEVLFSILLGTMLYINYFILTNWILDIANPDKGWVEVDGIPRRVMDTSWILGVIIGPILAPLTIFLYRKNVKRNKIIEMGFTTLFVLITTVVYIVFEVFG